MIPMRAALAALLALTAAQSLMAQNLPPTEDSVRHLPDLLQTHLVLDEAMNNMDGFMQKSLEQARPIGGERCSPNFSQESADPRRPFSFWTYVLFQPSVGHTRLAQSVL